ncbi:UNVERIFIED_CONTAM: hypothetical protein PYX00_003206 [Menopon gallinae]|uniref:Nucleotide exchange factor SIL1 n=1 Tax=Menopon gallinae TaxID=328185 RepID=A0AAW2I003_9NEOP
MYIYSPLKYVFLTLAFLNLCVNSSEKVNSTFQATNEWKKIEDGQSIPPGLHVRINLKTGYREAKLPDDTSETKSLVTTPEADKALDPEELKRILKNIKSAESSTASSNKFRSYEELKKDFVDLNVQVKTDIEILTNLVENFKKFGLTKSDVQYSEETEDEEILTTLVDLEYLVHQFDNAREFAKLNGFPDVIYKSLNSTNSEIRSEALRLHGSATQSNPRVQIAALDAGSINILLKILKFDEDINVRSRSLYALSCLLRRFPAAQHKLITDGGLTVFASVFDEQKQDLLKLQVKIITLIHDLLFERKDTKMNILEEKNKNQTDATLVDLKERLSQYENMDIEGKLVEQSWCSRISDWFVNQNVISELETVDGIMSPSADQHDLIEKVIDTLYVLSDICKPEFKSEKKLMELLLQLRNVYSKLSKTELNVKDDGSSHYYSSLHNILIILTEKFLGKTHIKEEL